MAQSPDNHPDFAFVAVLVRSGKALRAEAAFGEEKSVYVGRKGLHGARAGELVLIREGGRGRGEVERRLGRADSLPDLMTGIMEYFRVPRGFSRRALADAEGGKARVDRDDPGRRDLTHQVSFTIDPDEARDYDDAISLEDGPGEGEITLFVHIADVSYYIEAGSALDREAEKKAVSVYMPIAVEPMLPEILSNDICSLRPGSDRKCVTVEMVFRGSGGETRGEVRFYRSLIRSRARLTYNHVDDFITAEDDKGDNGSAVTGEVAERLRRCRRLAAALRRLRLGRGALAIETFEPEFRLSARNQVQSVKPSAASESHSLVEEFMIAANEAVARFLERKGAPCIYRVHEEPDPVSVAALFDLMEDLGIATPPFSLEQGSGRRAGEAVRELLRMHADGGGTFFTETVLRSLKQARYQEDNLGHYGLASTAYLHFTSPIRRYPDLIVHRSLLAALGLEGWSASRLELAAIAQHSSDYERRAAKVEHTGDDVVLANLLDRLLFEQGWDRRFNGEIISLIPSGLFLRFGGVYQGFVPARRLRGDYYVLNDKGSALVGRRSGRPFRLGDSMTVRVVRIDKLQGKIELEPAR